MALLKAILIVLTLSVITLGTPHTPRNKSPSYPDLLNADLDDLVDGLEDGDFTSVQLTKAYIARINQVNSALHVVIEINPDALTIAAVLDVERKAGKCRGPLHGVPMLIKDLIATKDKMNNTAGSYALLGATVPRDSTVIAKLRAAGVILLGKSNLSQWAKFRSTPYPGNGSSSNGWSSRGGQTTGAYYPNMDPQGSSSGSAVGTSLGLTWASLGTDAYGSIITPSGRGNVVGIRPTVGLTSLSLVIPASEHFDTVGPIARTVKDAAYVLAAIAGKDSYDNYTSAIPFATTPDYVAACKLSSLKGARIGIPRNAITTWGPDSPTMAAFEAAILVLKTAGAIIVDNANYTSSDAYYADQLDQFGNFVSVAASDFLTGLPKYLAQLTKNPQGVHNLVDVETFTESFSLEDYPQRDTAAWLYALYLVGYDNTDPTFWPLYQTLKAWGGPGGVTGALTKYKLDALILPSSFAVDLPAVAGLPVISVPMGSYPKSAPVTTSPIYNLVETAPNIPMGISFMGAQWSEASLIGLAYAYEQKTMFRTKIAPYSPPTAGLSTV